jgi:hypothetical protein
VPQRQEDYQERGRDRDNHDGNFDYPFDDLERTDGRVSQRLQQAPPRSQEEKSDP